MSDEFERQWLSDLPPDWTEKRADFLCNPYRVTVNPKDFGDELVAHYSIPQVQETGGPIIEPASDIDSSKLYVKESTLLVSKLNPRKKTICIAEPHPDHPTLASGEFVAINSKQMDRRYAYYLWCSEKVTDRLSAIVQSVTRSHQRVNPADILKLPWKWPPLDTQRRIARFLDEKTAQIDGLIERKRALLDRLAEKRQALITRAVTKGLNPDAPMKPSGIDWLGDIPEHWQVQRLRFSVEKIEQGWSPQCENRSAESEEWGVLKVGCVNGEHYNETENKALPSDLDPVERYEVADGDILISRANTKELLGSAAMVEGTQGRIIFSDKLYRLTLIDEIDPRYLVGVLRSPLSRFQYEQEATGTSGSMQNIGQDTIKNLLHPLPPIEEQRIISQAIQVIRSESIHIEKKVSVSIDKLIEYRTTLITSAVTGKITELQ